MNNKTMAIAAAVLLLGALAACRGSPRGGDAFVEVVSGDQGQDGDGGELGARCPESEPYFSGIQCWQCMTHEHCAQLNPELFCLAGSCADIEECSYCVPPAPICVRAHGILTCRDCLDDSWCKSVSCDTDNNLCDYAFDPGDVTFGCTTDDDCRFAGIYRGDLQLACDTTRGACYDLNGWCAGGADCPKGSSCHGMAAFRTELEAVKAPLSETIVNDREGFCECTTEFMPLEDRKAVHTYLAFYCTHDNKACASKECYSGICVNIHSLAVLLEKDTTSIPSVNVCMSPVTLLALLPLDM